MLRLMSKYHVVFKVCYNMVKKHFFIYNPRCPHAVDGAVDVVNNCLNCRFFDGFLTKFKGLRLICLKNCKKADYFTRYKHVKKAKNKQELIELYLEAKPI